ncbi:MAG TPA: hypothetical protein VNA19_00260 [Pyrinomonadaceae bacterium]|jgi:hypothetical protein|nr:hypothetical protein [Pyrinomonadaceae bacterium]
MSLEYRLLMKEDLPALQKLWKEEAGWGKLSEQMWQRFVVEAPLGGVSGTVATDGAGGPLVGQFAFVPSLVKVGGREYRAFRPGAPIVARTQRFLSANPLAHPAVAMYMHAVKALRARGDGLLYMVPDPRWVRLFRMFPKFQAGKFPLWRLDLPLRTELPMPEGYDAAPLAVLDDERIDRLWTAWSRFHDCSVVRDSRTLPWKIGGGDYTVLGIERAGELVGLVASRKKGDRQWLVCDVLAADDKESLRATFVAVVRLAHERSLAAPASQPICKVTVLVTPVLEPTLRALGFVRDAYDFPVIIHILNSAIGKDEIAPSKWYVSAND